MLIINQSWMKPTLLINLNKALGTNYKALITMPRSHLRVLPNLRDIDIVVNNSATYNSYPFSESKFKEFCLNYLEDTKKDIFKTAHILFSSVEFRFVPYGGYILHKDFIVSTLNDSVVALRVVDERDNIIKWVFTSHLTKRVMKIVSKATGYKYIGLNSYHFDLNSAALLREGEPTFANKMIATQEKMSTNGVTFNYHSFSEYEARTPIIYINTPNRSPFFPRIAITPLI